MTRAPAVDWSNAARADLETIEAVIARDSPVYARHVAGRIIETVDRLARFWESGRRVPEAPDLDAVREVVQQPYRIIYRANPDGFTVVTIVHGRGNARQRPSPPPAPDWSSGGHRR